jgi:hypothetical protein
MFKNAYMLACENVVSFFQVFQGFSDRFVFTDEQLQPQELLFFSDK